MRPRPSFVAIITCLGVTACGGSSHSSSSTQTTDTATATATSQTTTAQSRTVYSTTFSGGDAISSTTTTTSAPPPPEAFQTKTHKHHGEDSSHGGVSQGAHVEANIAVSASGDISPPVVSVPSGVGVELHVTNHGSGAATVALSVSSHASIHVAPGAKGTLESGGLKNGTYRILVNGGPKGQLMIGAQGGP